MPAKVCTVKAMDFPVVMYGCESWTIRKAECRRIDAFLLETTLGVPWTEILKEMYQSIPKEINPVIGKTDADAETRTVWTPDEKS